MNSLIKDLSSTNKFFREDAERVARQLITAATITKDVIRWNSNNQVPPVDILELAEHIGLPINLAKCKMVRDEENAAFIAEAMKNFSNNAENDAEARAAFGPGVKLVNVITGRRWTT